MYEQCAYLWMVNVDALNMRSHLEINRSCFHNKSSVLVAVAVNTFSSLVIEKIMTVRYNLEHLPYDKEEVVAIITFPGLTPCHLLI